MRVIAEMLEHPEGPDHLPDGRVVFVETWTGRVKAVDLATGTVSLFADVGGGPNACCVDADGNVLITQNGGRWYNWLSERPVTPGIQKIDHAGKVTHVVTHVDGIACTAPNDLCFGRDGRLYFTDPGDWTPPGGERAPHGPSHVFAVDAAGQGEIIAELGDVYPNGIAASDDGIVWGESHTRLIKRWRHGGGIDTLAELPQDHVPDGMKFDTAGRLWITTVSGGTIDVLNPADGTIEEVDCPMMPLNCVFVSGGLLVTDGGAFDPAIEDVPRRGRITILPVSSSGRPLFRGRF